MFRAKNIIKIFSVLFIGLMASHCAISYMRPHPVLEPEDFHKEIARLEAGIVEKTDLSELTDAYLQLALLYSHDKNPSPDYSRALKELELYMALAPEDEKTSEVKSLFAVLRELKKVTDELKKLTDESKQVKRKTEEMGLKIQQLTQENQELKETVEELKQIDINIEERRREVK